MLVVVVVALVVGVVIGINKDKIVEKVKGLVHKDPTV